MASSRSLWLLDQISFLLGACASSVRGWLCTLGTGDSVDEVGVTDLVSSWRAVVVIDREARRGSPRADRK